MNKLIVVSGGFRTGSTVVFNLCRELMLKKNPACESGGVPLLIAMERVLETDYVLKAHNVHTPFTEKILHVHTVRDPLEVAVSLKLLRERLQKAPFPTSGWFSIIQKVRDAMECTSILKRRGGVAFIEYEAILSSLIGVATSIARFLDVDLGPRGIAKIVRKYTLQEVTEYCDKIDEVCEVTQYRQVHIGPYQGRTNEKVREHLPQRIADELRGFRTK